MKRRTFLLVVALLGRDEADHRDLTLPSGLEAVTVRVQFDTCVAGFILPGSRIGLLTYVPDPAAPTKNITRFLVRNVLLVKVWSESGDPTAKALLTCFRTLGVPAPSWVENRSQSWLTFTVAVNPEQARTLKAASSQEPFIVVLEKPHGLEPACTSGAKSPFVD